MLLRYGGEAEVVVETDILEVFCEGRVKDEVLTERGHPSPACLVVYLEHVTSACVRRRGVPFPPLSPRPDQRDGGSQSKQARQSLSLVNNISFWMPGSCDAMIKRNIE